MWKGKIGVGVPIFVKKITAQTLLREDQLRSVIVLPGDVCSRSLQFLLSFPPSQTHLSGNEPPESPTNVSHAATSLYAQIITAKGIVEEREVVC